MPLASCLHRVGLALRANLAAPVGVWLQRVHAMVPDPVRTGALPESLPPTQGGRGKATPPNSCLFQIRTLYSTPPLPTRPRTTTQVSAIGLRPICHAPNSAWSCGSCKRHQRSKGRRSDMAKNVRASWRRSCVIWGGCLNSSMTCRTIAPRALASFTLSRMGLGHRSTRPKQGPASRNPPVRLSLRPGYDLAHYNCRE